MAADRRPVSSCPTPAELRQCFEGLAPTDDDPSSSAAEQDVRAHVQQCDTCRRQLGDLAPPMAKDAPAPDGSSARSLPASADDDSSKVELALPRDGELEQPEVCDPTITRAMGAQERASVSFDSPEARLPDRVGSVDVLRRIGRGGMGVVHLGRDRMLNRDVAVKFLLNVVAGADDPRFEEFLKGAQQAARLRHPNLVTVFQATLADSPVLRSSIPCLVMEYVDGPTLGDLIRPGRSVGVGVAVRIASDIASAVAALHEHGTIHRDLKPSNILFDSSGHLYVTDFGLACGRPRTGEAGGAQPRIAGTPQYMAPEMFRGTVSPRTDVYALGVVLFELLAGDPPFDGSFDDVRAAHIERAPPTSKLESAGIAPALIEVIERAMHKTDIFRFKTAFEFRRALQAAMQGETSLASDLDLQKFVQRFGATDDEHDGSAKTPRRPSSGSSSYFDRITELASAKHVDRRHTPDAIDDEPAEDAAPIEHVESDTLCSGCGYNLRGLSIEGRCPECGLPVERSLLGDQLAGASPEWLQRVFRGLKLLIAAVVVVVVGRFVPIVALFVLDAATGTGWGAAVGTYAPDLIRAASLVLIGLGLVNVTAIEPRLCLSEGEWAVRRITRTLGLAAVACFVASMTCKLLGFEAARAVASELVRVLVVATLIGGLWYLRGLAVRVPDRPLADSFRRCAILAMIAFPASIALDVVGAIQVLSDSALGRVVMALQVMATLLGLVAMFWVVSVVSRLDGALRDVVARARPYPPQDTSE